MNKKLTLLLAVLMLVNMVGVMAFATVGTSTIPVIYSDIKIVLDGTRIVPKDANGEIVDPFIYEGTTYMPVRAVSEALGLNVEWDDAAKSVLLTTGGEKRISDEEASGLIGGKGIIAEYNNIKVYLDGKLLELRDANGEIVEPFTSSGTTYLPLRAIAEALGLAVTWHEDTQTAELTTADAAGETDHPVIEIVMKNGDIITAELYPEVAPVTVENFLKLVDSNFFDGLIFHRVIPGFMIQGGGYDQNLVQKPAKSIYGEFTSNGFANNLKHTRGVLSMARTVVPDSASSQFFIMVDTAPWLDGEYAAFGKVLDGMDTVDKIVNQPTDNNDCPLTAQIIDTIRRKAE